MLRTLLLAGILAAAPMAAASAKSPELTDGNYARAARCLAFSSLPQLQGDTFDVSLLQSAYEAAGARRSPGAVAEARDAERAARIAGRRGGAEATVLRLQRDQACASFVSMGLANNGAPQAPAG